MCKLRFKFSKAINRYFCNQNLVAIHLIQTANKNIDEHRMTEIKPVSILTPDGGAGGGGLGCDG